MRRRMMRASPLSPGRCLCLFRRDVLCHPELLVRRGSIRKDGLVATYRINDNNVDCISCRERPRMRALENHQIVVIFLARFDAGIMRAGGARLIAATGCQK